MTDLGGCYRGNDGPRSGTDELLGSKSRLVGALNGGTAMISEVMRHYASSHPGGRHGWCTVGAWPC